MNDLKRQFPGGWQRQHLPPRSSVLLLPKPLDTGFYNLTTARTFQPILTPVPPGCFISPTAPNCIPNYTGAVDPDDDGIEPSN
jgi:hypothetical protein